MTQYARGDFGLVISLIGLLKTNQMRSIKPF